MSKFLKVIVNLFLVFAILIAGAILVPPLLGVSTTMIDSASMDTNLPVGSITYSQSTSVSEIAIGDKILVEGDGSAYVYVVESADVATGKFTVLDENNHQTETQEQTFRNEELKVVLTVPYIAYLMVAMHSVEGLIIIGLVVLFVIILFILSELWKKSDDDDEEEDTEEDKTEEGTNEIEKAETAETESVERVGKEAHAEPETELTSEELAQALAETYEMDEVSKAEETGEVLQIEETEDPVEVVQEEQGELDAEVEEPECFVKVARPSLEEILKKAEASGEKPEIVPYDELDITVVDYSELI